MGRNPGAGQMESAWVAFTLWTIISSGMIVREFHLWRKYGEEGERRWRPRPDYAQESKKKMSKREKEGRGKSERAKSGRLLLCCQLEEGERGGGICERFINIY